MQDAIRRALREHRAWLVRLRWVTIAERALVIGVGLGSLMMLAVVCVLGDVWSALLSAGGHLLVLLAVLVLVPRRLSTVLLGLVLLSLLNYSIASIAQYTSLLMIAAVYLALGLLLSPLMLAAWLRLKARWHGVGEYRAREDFRWLLTAAPLALRWRMHNAVHELYDESAASEDTAGKL